MQKKKKKKNFFKLDNNENIINIAINMALAGHNIISKCMLCHKQLVKNKKRIKASKISQSYNSCNMHCRYCFFKRLTFSFYYFFIIRKSRDPQTIYEFYFV